LDWRGSGEDPTVKFLRRGDDKVEGSLNLCVRYTVIRTAES